MPKLDKYEVVLLDDSTKNRWTFFVNADSFAHAEDLAVDVIAANKANGSSYDDEIIAINKEYK